MNKWTVIMFLSVGITLGSCGRSQTGATNYLLSAAEFDQKIKNTPGGLVLDVRTPDEYSKGHLINATNYDWNGNGFKDQVAHIDKSRPVFVYCLSGGRSASAAAYLRNVGFKEVYELSGGIMKWRGSGLPETTENKKINPGMSKDDFNTMITSDKLVLIDFYADWCGPCQKMKPYLEEIALEYAATVQVIRINADDNQQLCKDLKIDALPVLQLYKNQQLTWNHTGFIEKEEVVKQFENK